MQEKYFFETDFSYLDGNVIFLDVDGTLFPDGEMELSPEGREAVLRLKEKNTVFLCSNKVAPGRNGRLASLLGIFFVEGKAGKPSKKFLKKIPETYTHMPFVVIGDKILTDGLFAFNIKAKFFKTKKMVSGKESFKVQVIDFIDKIASKIYAVFVH